MHASFGWHARLTDHVGRIYRSCPLFAWPGNRRRAEQGSARRSVLSAPPLCIRAFHRVVRKRGESVDIIVVGFPPFFSRRSRYTWKWRMRLTEVRRRVPGPGCTTRENKPHRCEFAQRGCWGTRRSVSASCKMVEPRGRQWRRHTHVYFVSPLLSPSRTTGRGFFFGAE